LYEIDYRMMWWVYEPRLGKEYLGCDWLSTAGNHAGAFSTVGRLSPKRVDTKSYF